MTQDTHNMTDQQIVRALIGRDKEVTRTFFYITCYPLFKSIFEHYYTDCDNCIEFINEIYIYIMSPQQTTGRSKLESFRFESTLTTWIKVVCLYYCYTRFEEKQRIDIDPNYDLADRNDSVSDSIQLEMTTLNKEDIMQILALMPNIRYRELIRLRYLEGYSNDATAEALGMTMDNYYNKHRLAKAQYLQVYRKEAHDGDDHPVKYFNPAISEEKFAAGLDSMLTSVEMDEVSTLIDNDRDMQSILASAETLDNTLFYYDDEFLYPEVFADPLSPADFESPELNLPTIIPDALSDQTNLIPDFLPDSGFDILQASDTPDTDNSPIADMGQDTNDINL